MATNLRQSNFSTGNYTGRQIYVNNSDSFHNNQLSNTQQHPKTVKIISKHQRRKNRFSGLEG